MVDPQKAAKLIRQHFEELTTEQFIENIHDLSHEAFLDRERKEQRKQRDLKALSASSLKLKTLPTEK